VTYRCSTSSFILPILHIIRLFFFLLECDDDTVNSTEIFVLCTVLHCAVMFSAALHRHPLQCTVLYCNVLHCTAPHFTVQCTLPYRTALCCTALHCHLLQCTVMWCSHQCDVIILRSVSHSGLRRVSLLFVSLLALVFQDSLYLSGHDIIYASFFMKEIIHLIYLMNNKHKK
jgi:hypothetical protein